MTIISSGIYGKDKKKFYRQHDQLSSYSKGMFVPYMDFDMNSPPNTFYSGMIPYSNMFLPRTTPFIESTFSQQVLFGTLYMDSRGNRMDPSYVNQERDPALYAQYQSLILMRFNRQEMIPRQLMSYPIDTLHDSIMHAVQSDIITDESNTNIYLTSCRKPQYMYAGLPTYTNANERRETMLADKTVKFYKVLLKIIMEIKHHIAFMEESIPYIEQITQGYGLPNKEPVNHRSKVSAIHNRINAMTTVSVSKNAISKVTKNGNMNGMNIPDSYNIFDMVDEIDEYIDRLNRLFEGGQQLNRNAMKRDPIVQKYMTVKAELRYFMNIHYSLTDMLIMSGTVVLEKFKAICAYTRLYEDLLGKILLTLEKNSNGTGATNGTGAGATNGTMNSTEVSGGYKRISSKKKSSTKRKTPTKKKNPTKKNTTTKKKPVTVTKFTR